MRAYLAVLKDSFREALASRVLWILIVVTTLVLAILAPLGIREQKIESPTPQTAAADEDAESDKNSRKEETGIAVTYLGWSATDPFPMSHAQAIQMVKTVLAGIIDFFVGTLGVLTAILVTSPIMPQTFEPGAIDLLLSKPVSRALLFLTKFCGGCAFITLVAAYFIAGLWLIVGFQFDIWSARVFLAIPVLLFLFSIYYSVSSLAGIIWRNAIVSVIITVLFWLLCFTVGAAKQVVEALLVTPDRIVRLFPADQALLGTTDQGLVRQWNAAEAVWQDVFLPEGRPTRVGAFAIPQAMIGPVYDPAHDRLLAIDSGPRGRRGAFGFLGAAEPLLIGTRADAWKRSKGPTAPVGTIALFARPGGEVVAMTKAAAYRLVEDESKASEPAEKRMKFVRSGPEPPLKLESSAAAAINPDTGGLAVFSRGTLTVLEAGAAEKYRRKTEKEIVSPKEASAAVVAYGGQTIVLALSDGRVLVLDAADLSTKAEYKPAGSNPPRFAAASPGGRWLAVSFHTRQFWLYDAREQRPANLSFSGSGDISAAAFSAPNELWLADRSVRATQYELDPFRVETRFAPPMAPIEMAYRYAILPIYTIFPKPGELGNVVSYLLTGEKSMGQDPMRQDLSQGRITIDVAGPIWSSLVFLAVVLTGTCLYISRADF